MVKNLDVGMDAVQDPEYWMMPWITEHNNGSLFDVAVKHH